MWLAALWHLVGALTDAGPAAFVTALVVLATVAAVALLVRTPALTPVATASLLRHAARAGVPRHRDPDAPGRTRPRGPTGR
jgi:hypothetical protein